MPRPKPNARLRAEIPVGRYDWNESRIGALKIDVVEHNGGSSLGYFAYTLTVVDIVSGWSRRRAILGRSQALSTRRWPRWSKHGRSRPGACTATTATNS
ncbi:MAG TPA: hypothetical protein VIL95_07095 [Bacillota bacterium]